MPLQSASQTINGTEQNTCWTGEKVCIRLLAVRDRELMRRFFVDLSPASRYQRFMGPKQQISESLMKMLSSTDQSKHVAYLACVGGPRHELMVAEARYVVEDSDPGTAEFAVAVTDGWQGRGIAARLLERLENRAARCGVRKLVCMTLRNNQAMLRLAERSGYTIMPKCAEPRAICLAKSIGKPISLLH